ncbi:transcriptional regulator GcvA [Halovulum marinum]|nr:transcriptional regulator GcvA [Halovulum marinum]
MSPLPPLTGLRAFEAAARHLSFKAAAEELHVTPAAISQQVRALEEFVGQPLFRRLTRALALTEAGAAAAPVLTEGFARLAEAAARMRSRPAARDRVLTISAAPSFASKWLLPRLERFRARHPEYEIRIDASDSLTRFDGTEDVDLALRYGRGHYGRLRADRLTGETAFPVCSPALASGTPPLRTPDDLCRHTLLHIAWTMQEPDAPSWPMWLRAAGVTGIDSEAGLRFSIDSMAVQAALEGHGVALVTRSLVADDLAAGRLVRPFPPGERDRTSFAYFLVYPPETAEQPKIAAFRAWVLDEVAAAGG